MTADAFQRSIVDSLVLPDMDKAGPEKPLVLPHAPSKCPARLTGRHFMAMFPNQKLQ